MDIITIFLKIKNIFIYSLSIFLCLSTSLPNSILYSQDTSKSCVDIMTDRSSFISSSAPLTRSSFLDIPLETTEDKIKALFLISQDIPELFSISTDYPIDFTTLLGSNQDLLSNMKEAIPEYSTILEQRPPLLDISILAPKQENKYLDRTTTDQDIKRWIQSLKMSLSSLKKEYPTTSLKEILKHLLDVYNKTLDFNNILGALHNIVPNSIAFDKNKSLSFQERIRILTEDLPQTFEENIIKWDIIIKDQSLKNFLSSFSDKNKILYILQSQSQLFDLISILVIHNTHMNYLNGSKNTFFMEMRQTLNQLDNLSYKELETIINSFQEKDLKLLEDSSFIKQNILEFDVIFRNFIKISKLIFSNTRSYLSSKKLNNSFSYLSLRLKEVLPISALFRGYVGVDCASTISFAYPNDPFERVFFIYNDKNETIGYISSTEILINDKKSLYVNTVSGSHLSSYQVRILLDGLNNIKKELGVESISYPILPILQNNMNQVDILNELKNRLQTKTSHEAYEQTSIGKSYQNLLQNIDYFFRYQHEEIRNFISKFSIKYNTDRYDGIDKNYRLRIDESDINPKLVITVKERTVKENEYSFSKPIFDKKVIIALWNSIEKRGFNSEHLRNLMHIIGLNEKQILSLYEDLLNKDQKDSYEYLSYILEKYNIKLEIKDLSLEALARVKDFTTNKQIQNQFIKKIKDIKIQSIYFEDSFNIIAARIRFISTIPSKRLKILKQYPLYNILYNSDYTEFKKLSNRLLLAKKKNSKFDIIKQGIMNNIVILEDIDKIFPIKNYLVFIVEKDKKFAIIMEEKINPFINIDLDKIEPIEVDPDTNLFNSKYSYLFKVYKHNKVGLIEISTFDNDFYIDNTLFIKYDDIKYRIMKNDSNVTLEYFELYLDKKVGIFIPNVTQKVECMYDEISEIPSLNNFYIRLSQNNKYGMLIVLDEFNRFNLKEVDPIYNKVEVDEPNNTVTCYTKNRTVSFRIP